MIVNGIMIPISSFLLGRFSTRQLFISKMSIFSFGTLVAGIAPNFELLLLRKVIKSSGAGVTLPHSKNVKKPLL